MSLSTVMKVCSSKNLCDTARYSVQIQLKYLWSPRQVNHIQLCSIKKPVERDMLMIQKMDLVDEYLKAKVRNIFNTKKLKRKKMRK